MYAIIRGYSLSDLDHDSCNMQIFLQMVFSHTADFSYYNFDYI